VLIEADSVLAGGLSEVELEIDVAEGTPRLGKRVYEPTLELPRLHDELPPRGMIDDAYADVAFRDAVTKLRREEVLDLVTREHAHAREDGRDHELRPRMTEQGVRIGYGVRWIAFDELHAPRHSILAGRGERTAFAHDPEGQQADTELALHPGFACALELALDRIADMGCNIAKISDAFAVVDDLYIGLVLRFSSDDRHVLRARVDRVFHELCDGLQGVILRKRDDGNHVPVIADLEFSGLAFDLVSH